MHCLQRKKIISWFSSPTYWRNGSQWCRFSLEEMHFTKILCILAPFFRQFSWRYYNRNCAFYTQSSILVWLPDLTHQFNVFSENQVINLRRGFSMILPARRSLSFFDIYRFTSKNMWRDNFSHFPFFTQPRPNFIYLRLISIYSSSAVLMILILVLILNLSLPISLLQENGVEGRGGRECLI